MRTSVVVELYEIADSLAQLHYGVGGVEVIVLLLDGAPEALYPDVALTPAASVHTDENPVLFQQIFPRLGGVLRALVSVDCFQSAELPNCLFQKLIHIVGRERVAEPPANDVAAVGIYYGIETHEAANHADV